MKQNFLLPTGLISLMILVSTSALAMPNVQRHLFNSAVSQKNYAAAQKILQPFVHQNDAEAQYNLGVMYDNGFGVARDEHQAISWYQKAANQGYAMAQFNLGMMYEDGQGVAQDYHQAFTWYQKAAHQGHAKAQNALGLLYVEGKGVPQDFRQARFWWNKAALQTTNAEAKQAAQQNLRKLTQMGK